MYRSRSGWERAYSALEAYWVHDGNPERPHALLTSGKHSGGFFYSKPVVEDSELLHQAAVDLADKLAHAGFNPAGRGVVVGPATGATKLAHALSRVLTTRGREWKWASPDKVGDGPNKQLVWNERKIDRGDRVLLVEDVISTGSSVRLAADLVRTAGGSIFPYTAVLVNRSGLLGLEGRQTIALISRLMPMHESTNCPLCKMGSEAIRPKGNDGENWKRLTAPY